MNSEVSVESVLQAHVSGNKTLKENLKTNEVPIADLIDFNASVSTPPAKAAKSTTSSSPPTAQSTHLLD
ncbi:unnamed protein product [Auanema sp. JU1783]|nr:unnamed protein product [Auanema sp. JU1783]